MIDEFYDVSFGNQILFQIGSWPFEVAERTYRLSGERKQCEWCSIIIIEKETIEHLVVECGGHRQEIK